MIRNNILGKTASYPVQLEKVSEVFERNELQLMGDFGKTTSVQDVLDNIQDSGARIEVVHTPIVIKDIVGEVKLDYINNTKSYEEIRMSFELAQRLAEINHKPMPVVIHSNATYEILMHTQLYYEATKEKVKTLLELYPDTIFCIENTTPYTYMKDKDGSLIVEAKGGFNMDNHKIARQLQADLPHLKDQIGVTIDTCHALITERFAELIGYPGALPSPEECLKDAKDLCKVIHLNNFIGDGISKEVHSTAFLKEDKPRLSSILKAIQIYTPIAYITLEINEEDYVKDPTKNKRITLDTILEILDGEVSAF